MIHEEIIRLLREGKAPGVEADEMFDDGDEKHYGAPEFLKLKPKKEKYGNAKWSKEKAESTKMYTLISLYDIGSIWETPSGDWVVEDDSFGELYRISKAKVNQFKKLIKKHLVR